MSRWQKAIYFRYDYWCLSAFVFQSYWTDYSTSLQTISQLFGSAPLLVPFMRHSRRLVTDNNKALPYFFSRNECFHYLKFQGGFFSFVCVFERLRVCDRAEARKRWWLVLFHPVLDSSPCSPARGRSVDSVAKRGSRIKGPSPPVELVIAPDKSPKPCRAEQNRKRVQVWAGKVRLFQ